MDLKKRGKEEYTSYKERKTLKEYSEHIQNPPSNNPLVLNKSDTL